MAKEIEWHTEKRKISQLKPFDKNPRILKEKNYEDLKKSLRKFNLAEIPAIDIDGQIIAGHQRLKILQELKGDIEIDVRVPNRKLTQKEFEEYNIRSNKNTGDWDMDILANDFDLSDLLEWGFNERELGTLSIEKINELEEWNKNNIDEFQIADKEPKIVLCFKTEKKREKWAIDNRIEIIHKQAGTWTARL